MATATYTRSSQFKKLSTEWGGIPEALPQVKKSVAVEGPGIGGITFLEVCGHQMLVRPQWMPPCPHAYRQHQVDSGSYVSNYKRKKYQPLLGLGSEDDRAEGVKCSWPHCPAQLTG